LREQPLERLEMLRIARVNHRVAVQVQSHARSMSP
jgi:ribosomal protein L30/L7E